MNRRNFIATLPALMAASETLTAAGMKAGRLGICSFSCHRAWQAVREKSTPVSFADGPTFFDYARSLGADGVQTSFATLDESAAARFRVRQEQVGGYYEGDVRLPKTESELEKFEQEVMIVRAAGGSVARTVFTGSRRYEAWKTLDEFKAFRVDASKRLAMVEPIVKRHRLKLAVENHKDFTAEELALLMREFSSEWIGVNVDTGNNLALLEDPYYTIDTLAPFAMSVHLKDMAVQPAESGFRLSEVPCGNGFLDLSRIVTTLRRANPNICFNLEMATRDPLVIPCLAESYWATFPERRATHLLASQAMIKSHPIRIPPPSIIGKTMPEQLLDEESNNRVSLDWMHRHL